ncbi:MAG: methyltransferase domain-containing protein [Planctomycetia bacterium]|nr:methyltransferase domain-containing protein [Planctomycetia bacterium]
MLSRVLEPEAMDTLDEARDYDAIDHRDVNRLFAADVLAALQQAGLLSTDQGCHVIDIGTGTARIPIELVRQAREAGVGRGLIVAAVDLAAEMLVVAKENVAAAGMADVIRLERLDVKTLPYPDERFAAVLSNSIVHHIPDPAEAIAEAVRVTRPGGLLFFRDLRRPRDAAELERLVTLHTAGSSPTQRELFAASLRAALTVDEIGEIVAALGFPAAEVRATSDRHWTWRSTKP